MREDLTTDLVRLPTTGDTELLTLLVAAREALRSGKLALARSHLIRLDEQARSSGSISLAIEGAAVAAIVDARDGRMDDAWCHVDRAKDLAFEHNDVRGEALDHITRSTLCEMLGDFEGFEREARAARRAAETSRDPSLIARADMALAIAASMRGDMSAALLRFGSAMANFTAAGDEFFAAIVQCNIGRVHVENREGAAAIEHYLPAVATLERLNGEAYVGLSGLAEALALVGRHAEALDVAERALDSALNFGERALAFAHLAHAAVLRAAGSLAEALPSCCIAEKLADRVDTFVAADAALELASVYAASGRVGEALGAIARAEERFEGVGAKRGLSRVADSMEAVHQISHEHSLARVRDIEERFVMPRRHGEAVAGHALDLADHLKLSMLDRRWLELGALLHDIGYSCLPSHILASEAMRTGQRIVVRLHCHFGDALLQKEGFPWQVRAIVRHHHERWDGTGYPDRLRANAIPLTARITAIAERYTALRTPRGSRPGLSRTDALSRLSEEGGHALDPALVAAFTTLMETRAENSRGHKSAEKPIPTPEEWLSKWDTPSRIQAALGISYVLGPEIRGGGMSRLFRARDPLLERDVVVKVLPPEKGENAAKRFRREMAIAANLAHPRILPILHAGLADSLPYFVMPYVSGGSVRDRLSNGAIDVESGLSILRDVAEALTYAHEKGVVHRDLKPGNVLLQDGRGLLGDFGVARQARRADVLSLTDTGESVGTVGYMAPEQLLADGEPAPTMDVYSFGVLAYEMLSGAPPFSATTMNALMFAHITKEPPPLATVATAVPQYVATLVDSALRKSASERPRDGGELASALMPTRVF